MRRRAVARAAAVGGAAYYGARRGEQAAQAAQPQAPAPPTPTAAATSAAPTMDEKIEQIRQLAKLRDDGILTEEEFAAQKQQILAG